MKERDDWIPVASSMVEKVAYEFDDKTLLIKFHGSKDTYHYMDVPEGLVHDLLGAESVGKFFSSNVKGHFSYFKEPPDEERPL